MYRQLCQEAVLPEESGNRQELAARDVRCWHSVCADWNDPRKRREEEEEEANPHIIAA